MPQFILLSFCNIPTRTTSPLLCLQVPDELNDSFSYTPVSLGYPDLILTATGLASTKGKIFILFASRQYKTYIAMLQASNLSPLYYQELPEIKDGHSMLVIDDCLYIVSTGTDEVICYDIQKKSLENPRIIWRASDTQTDTHHVNSIVEKKGEILISAFGPKAGQTWPWATASHGYIYNITSNSLIADGIYHPHSLSVANDQIYYSDSQRNSLCKVGQADTVFNLNGYTRGVAWLSSDLLCAATSIGRRVSKSTGLIVNPAIPGQPAGECSLVIGSISETKIIRTIDLSWFGPEIYDVLALQDTQIELLEVSNVSQQAERHAIQILFDELIQYDQKVQTLSAQVAEKAQQVAEKEQQVAEKEQQVAEKEQQVAERDWRIANIEAQLSDVYASRSWRITAPIRAIGAKLSQMSARRGASAVDRPDSDKS